MESFLDTVILTLYGDAFTPREEYLILNLFKVCKILVQSKKTEKQTYKTKQNKTKQKQTKRKNKQKNSWELKRSYQM